MYSNILTNSIVAVILTVIVCFVISTLLPGIERKYVHARIQQRVGPLVFAPGIMAPLKFLFKENVEVSSPVPKLYKILPILCFIVILCVFIALTPQAYKIPALSSLVAIVGFLKVEEICYVLMGALSKSVMSVRMPFPDRIKGAAHIKAPLSFIEDISAKRSLRMITYGSFPLYLALFAPVTAARSIFLKDIVAFQQVHGPFLFTVAGGIAAIVFFIGYMIILNEYPFSIIKAKSDVIEGPYMEYAAKYRSIVFITRGFFMFVLGSVFSVLFIGVPPSIFSLGILVNIAVALIFVFMMGIFSAFAPVFTNKQLLPTILGTTLLGILAIALGLL
ncbi:membrane-bound hydrogenase subunit ehbO [Methanobrevibacter gottschalkii]|uniref:Membrane-bound hydrogenase subunit ehbO n=2 Tax=Methanobrevibacter gottschalkii TaxID=190974 RepID=A0A3N5B5Q3_9EURY|nr:MULTISPECIES: NADH-quinone oxidoreductase subunit H [Methanobrevibacter]MCQ2970181.1 NADH-quinone oxidoreductase subunit H [archaeon]OEC93826.1 NADH dehydrogenase [Methanobrevibacter sp. A27]RPF52663.1 membrane-bound hydrogenase subunit ehbO [Methanobrevibacter gottschalkii DSM 11977]SEK28757.1 membrane-bound hydrogenase subunit ehbO [Methanobrevibacter gottschalkii]